MKQKIDQHNRDMNTFENQYVENPEWSDFQKKVLDANLAEKVNASRGEYWDKNWLDSNYKSGAYLFDNNGLLTYQGKTYAPFGDHNKEGIAVPVRTPNGISYGAILTYYPIEVPQQYIEKKPDLINQTIQASVVDALKQQKRDLYATQNTSRRYPNYIAYYTQDFDWRGNKLPKNTTEYVFLDPNTHTPVFKRYDKGTNWTTLLRDMYALGLPKDYSYDELKSTLANYNSFFKKLNAQNYDVNFKRLYNNRVDLERLVTGSEPNTERLRKFKELSAAEAKDYYSYYSKSPQIYIQQHPGTIHRPSEKEIEDAVQLSISDFNKNK